MSERPGPLWPTLWPSDRLTGYPSRGSGLRLRIRRRARGTGRLPCSEGWTPGGDGTQGLRSADRGAGPGERTCRRGAGASSLSNGSRTPEKRAGVSSATSNSTRWSAYESRKLNRERKSCPTTPRTDRAGLEDADQRRDSLLKVLYTRARELGIDPREANIGYKEGLTDPRLTH